MNRPFLSVAVLASLSTIAGAQVTAGQTDTFNADVMNWQGAQPLWMADGGPLGTGDGFMQLTSTGGFGQYSRMATFNGNQWAGNFTSAGIGSISVDFRNFGNTDLVMRLTFFDPSLVNRWVSNATANLAAGSGWQHFTFQLDASLFTRTSGTNTFADEMQNVSRMMFRHDPGSPSSNGVAIAAVLGVDNVHSAPVPEPASLLILGGGIAAILRRRRHSR